MNTNIFSQEFLSEVKELALKIAFRQRREHHMQDAHTLARKFDAEMQELAEASEPWDELPDICYYAACLQIINIRTITREALARLSTEIEERGVTVAQLEAATLAKYRLRAENPKNIEVERAAILAAIA